MRLLLLLFVCVSIFLAGMVFGGNQQTDDKESPFQVVEEIVPTKETHIEEVTTIQDPPQMNFTQKAASFLEGTVNGLYDFIVAFLYEVASIFFSIV